MKKQTSAGDGYREVMVERLRHLIAVQGTSVAGVERKLGRGRAYVADALRGDKKLAVEMIMEILDVIGVAPEDFFERTPARSRLRANAARRSPEDYEDARSWLLGGSPLLRALVVALERKGLVAIEELEELVERRAREYGGVGGQ